MSIKSYKIVDATQLDTDLASIASALKEKNGDSKQYDFPTDFVSAISNLYYDNDPNTESSLSVNKNTITAAAGYYPAAVSKSVNNGSVSISDDSMLITPTLTNNNGVITASFSDSKTISPNIIEGYVSTGSTGTLTVSGTASLTLTTANAATIIPSRSEQTAISANTYALGNIKVAPIPEQYITIDEVPGDFIGTDIPRKAASDVSVDILTRKIVIPAGYYAEAITLDIPEEPTPEPEE